MGEEGVKLLVSIEDAFFELSQADGPLEHQAPTLVRGGRIVPFFATPSCVVVVATMTNARRAGALAGAPAHYLARPVRTS
jgi:hypothetical protein